MKPFPRRRSASLGISIPIVTCDRNTFLLYSFLLRTTILSLNRCESFVMDLLSSTSISIPSTAEELLASYNSQAAELLDAYEEELYLSAESERNNSSFLATDVNNCHGFGVHTPIKSSDDTLQIGSQRSATLTHDPINCDGANYEVDEAGFCAFESLVGYPDDECLAAIDAANRNPARPHIKRGTDSMPAYTHTHTIH